MTFLKLLISSFFEHFFILKWNAWDENWFNETGWTQGWFEIIIFLMIYITSWIQTTGFHLNAVTSDVDFFSSLQLFVLSPQSSTLKYRINVIHQKKPAVKVVCIIIALNESDDINWATSIIVLCVSNKQQGSRSSFFILVSWSFLHLQMITWEWVRYLCLISFASISG